MVNIDYHCYHFYWKYKDQWSQCQKKKVKDNWSHSIILLIFILITLNLNPSSSTRFPRDPRPPILPAFILIKEENNNQKNVLLSTDHLWWPKNCVKVLWVDTWNFSKKMEKFVFSKKTRFGFAKSAPLAKTLLSLPDSKWARTILVEPCGPPEEGSHTGEGAGCLLHNWK